MPTLREIEAAANACVRQAYQSRRKARDLAQTGHLPDARRAIDIANASQDSADNLNRRAGEMRRK